MDVIRVICMIALHFLCAVTCVPRRSDSKRQSTEKRVNRDRTTRQQQEADSRLPAACPPRFHSDSSSLPPLPLPTARRSLLRAFAIPPPLRRSPATEQTIARDCCCCCGCVGVMLLACFVHRRLWTLLCTCLGVGAPREKLEPPRGVKAAKKAEEARGQKTRERAADHKPQGFARAATTFIPPESTAEPASCLPSFQACRSWPSGRQSGHP